MSIVDVRTDVRFWLHDPAIHVFTDAEIDYFLEMAVVPDSLGYKPMSVNYTPTWDVLLAAGYGWIWLGGLAANASLSYTVGDVTVQINQNYCYARARELMGSQTATATRRDEPAYELFRQIAFDGDNARHRS